MQKLKNTSRCLYSAAVIWRRELVPLLTHLGFRCIVTDDGKNIQQEAVSGRGRVCILLIIKSWREVVAMQPQVLS